MSYLLDTNICIYYLNRKENIVSKIQQIPDSDISISIVTIAELQYGAYNSKRIQNNLEKINSFTEIVQTIPLTTEITDKYAEI
jgi:tRNA(fMet)-specific endonuclease VapC